MSLNLAVAQRAQYLDKNGKPLSAGRVTYFEAVGTSILKSVFADPNGIVELSNPLLLDEGGFVPESGVFYGLGNYSVLVEKVVNPNSPIPIYAEEYTIPNVPGTFDASASGETVSFVDAVENIPNVLPNSCDMLYAPTYYAVEDNYDMGGGWFKWESNSTAPTNLGTIFATTASPAVGRFIRVFDSEIVQSSMFGVSPNRGSSMNSRILAGALYASQHNFKYVLNGGDIECNGDVLVECPSIEVSDAFKIIRYDSLIATKIILSGANIEVLGLETKINPSTSDLEIRSTNQMSLNPVWWGADSSGVADSYNALYKCQASANLSEKSVVYIDGQFVVSIVGIHPELRFNNLFFTENSYISTETQEIYILGSVDMEYGTVKVFRTPIEDFNYFNLSGVTPYAHWFFDSTPTEAELKTVCESMSLNGNQLNTLIWNDNRNYKMPSCANSVSMTKVTHDIKGGAQWFIDSTGEDAFQMYNTTIFPKWFSSNSFQTALYFAHRNGAALNGEGETYTSTSYFRTKTTLSSSFKIIDATLMHPTLSPTVLKWNGFLTMDNVIIQGSLGNNLSGFIESFKFSNCSFVGDGSSYFDMESQNSDYGTFENCDFSNYFEINISKDLLKISDCNFQYTDFVYLFGEVLEVVNNNFERGVNVHFWKSGIPTTTDESSKFCNNILVNSANLYNLKNVFVLNNTCDNITLTADNASTIIYNTIVKSNILKGNVIKGSNIATYGHICDVSDNVSVNNLNINTTNGYININYDGEVGENLFTIPMFLPYNPDQSPLTIFVVGKTSALGYTVNYTGSGCSVSVDNGVPAIFYVSHQSSGINLLSYP